MTIYLDHNANSPLSEAAQRALLDTLQMGPLNPGAAHSAGRTAHEVFQRDRHRIARAVGVRPSELILTSGGTESNNLAILGLVAGRPGAIVSCRTEHPAVVRVLSRLEAEGRQIVWLPVDEAGRIDLNALGAALEDNVALVTVMWANNETGVIHDIPAISALCQASGSLLHSDAVQAVGKLPMELRLCDSVSFTAHKLGGPVGIGGLFVNKGVALAPLLLGGGQQAGRRPGTEPVMLAHAFAAALESAGGLLGEMGRVQALRDQLEVGLRERFEGLVVHGESAPRLPNTCFVGFRDADAGMLLAELSERGILVATGSACGGTDGHMSPVLEAMGTEKAVANGTLRFSLGHSTSEADITRVLEVLPEIVRA